jgi:hypothetical protein
VLFVNYLFLMLARTNCVSPVYAFSQVMFFIEAELG